MRGEGSGSVRAAMRLLLDQQEARRYLLQASPADTTVVIPFNSSPMNQWTVTGNNPKALGSLLGQIDALVANGGTNIYTPVIKALESFKAEGNQENYSPAVILLSDGQPNLNPPKADLPPPT